jgi:DTW domain-containing protein YfiP
MTWDKKAKRRHQRGDRSTVTTMLPSQDRGEKCSRCGLAPALCLCPSPKPPTTWPEDRAKLRTN